MSISLHLFNKPVLIADFLDEFELLLAPVLVFLLVKKIGLQHVICCRIFADRCHALAQQLHASHLNGEVGFDILQRVANQLASRVFLDFRTAAEVDDTVDELLHPFHLLVVMSNVFLAELVKAFLLENLTLYLVYECAFREACYEEL